MEAASFPKTGQRDRRPGGGSERQETRIVYADGAERTEPIPPDLQVALWSRSLHEGVPGLVELAVGRRERDGSLSMRSRNDPRRYPRAGDQGALVRLSRRHRERGDELFASPLPKERPLPGRAGGIALAQVAWVDLDDAAGVALLRSFPHRPHLVLRSGSGGAHAYWRLQDPVEPEELEALNRALCGALRGDLASTDRARIMRLPGTHNHKAGSPCLIAYLDLARPGIAARELGRGLRDPDPPPPPASPSTRRRRAERLREDGVELVTPPEYFRALAAVEAPDGGGLVPCPLPGHRERIASCMVYPEAEQGWTCFGCGRGGTVYDLASLIEGGPSGRALRGTEFKRARRLVRERVVR